MPRPGAKTVARTVALSAWKKIVILSRECVPPVSLVTLGIGVTSVGVQNNCYYLEHDFVAEAI